MTPDEFQHYYENVHAKLGKQIGPDGADQICPPLHPAARRLGRPPRARHRIRRDDRSLVRDYESSRSSPRKSRRRTRARRPGGRGKFMDRLCTRFSAPVVEYEQYLLLRMSRSGATPEQLTPGEHPCRYASARADGETRRDVAFEKVDLRLGFFFQALGVHRGAGRSAPRGLHKAPARVPHSAPHDWMNPYAADRTLVCHEGRSSSPWVEPPGLDALAVQLRSASDDVASQ